MEYDSDQSVLARLTDRLKLALAKKYLDWVEALPEFRRGLISHLQLIRKFQRKEEKTSLESSRLPTGLDFRYSLCVLIEIFPVEAFKTLSSAIARLFPDRDPLGRRREFIDSEAPSLFAGSYSNVGILVREPKFTFVLPTATVKNLPPEVEYVQIEVYKVLPSAFVACFSAFLNERATLKVQKLMSTAYLPAVRFGRLVPFWPFGIAHSETPADLVREESVLGELVRIRTTLEDVIGRYFQGYFSGQGERQRPRLPAIERFDLNGVPSEEKEFRWGWGTPLGLDHRTISFDGYRENKRIFIFSSVGHCRLPVANRLIVFHDATEDPRAQDELLHAPADGPIGIIIQDIAILEFLKRIMGAVEALRVRIYRRLAENSLFMRFREDIRLHRHLQKESLLLNRLALEIAQGEKLYGSQPNPLASFQPIHKKCKGDLGKVFSEGIHFQLETISQHVELVTKSFSDYVATRNMGLMYVLTVVATLATILALVIATGEHMSWIRDAFHWLMNFFGR